MTKEYSNLTLEQRIELAKLNYYIKILEKDFDEHAVSFIKNIEPLYKKGILPEEIISKEVYDCLDIRSEEHPFYCNDIYNTFSEQLKKYEKTKKRN